MRTTAIVNLKGGVAKTVTCVNVAAILAHDHGKRVLVVDADSQANATEFFGGKQPGACTLGELLRRSDNPSSGASRHLPPEGEGRMAADSRRYNGISPEGKALVIRPSNVEGVDLLPADDNLMDLDLSAVKSKEADVEALRRLLQARSDDYDFVLIDCPPAFNAASAAALLAADDVIIPIKLDAFSLRGMANLTRQIDNMRRINPKLEISGLLPTMTYTSPRIRGALDILYCSDLHVYPKIRRTGRVDDMTFAQRPLIESSPRSAACVDYRRLVKAFMAEGNPSSGASRHLPPEGEGRMAADSRRYKGISPEGEDRMAANSRRYNGISPEGKAEGNPQSAARTAPFCGREPLKGGDGRG